MKKKTKLDIIHNALTVYLVYRLLNILIVGSIQGAQGISVYHLYIKEPDHYYSWYPHEVIPELQTVKEYDDLPFCQRALMNRGVYESNIPYNIKIVLMNTGFVILPWTSLGEYYDVQEKGWYSAAQHIIIYEVSSILRSPRGRLSVSFPSGNILNSGYIGSSSSL